MNHESAVLRRVEATARDKESEGLTHLAMSPRPASIFRGLASAFVAGGGGAGAGAGAGGVTDPPLRRRLAARLLLVVPLLLLVVPLLLLVVPLLPLRRRDVFFEPLRLLVVVVLLLLLPLRRRPAS